MNTVLGGRMGGRKTENDQDLHRSKHLRGIRVVSGCCLRRQQLSLILPPAVYEQEGQTPRELVTVRRDGWPQVMFGEGEWSHTWPAFPSVANVGQRRNSLRLEGLFSHPFPTEGKGWGTHIVTGLRLRIPHNQIQGCVRHQNRCYYKHPKISDVCGAQ
jgi:hypothetical protein